MKIIKNVYGLAILAIVMVLAVAAPALADTTTPIPTPGFQGVRGNEGMMPKGKGMMRSGVFGTVNTITGNIITISSTRGFGATATTTTFTVDATNAKITKDNTAGTVANILVGDSILVQGPMTGTSIVARMIRDGKMPAQSAPGQNGKENNNIKNNPKVPALIGNGEPVVAGTVTAINGSILTITNESKVTYTVDVSNAKITQDQNTVALSSISIGDTLIVQGTVNGNAVTAANVFAHPKPANAPGEGGQGQPEKGGGFLGGIGSFFTHLFGF